MRALGSPRPAIDGRLQQCTFKSKQVSLDCSIWKIASASPPSPCLRTTTFLATSTCARAQDPGVKARWTRRSWRGRRCLAMWTARAPTTTYLSCARSRPRPWTRWRAGAPGPWGEICPNASYFEVSSRRCARTRSRPWTTRPAGAPGPWGEICPNASYFEVLSRRCARTRSRPWTTWPAGAPGPWGQVVYNRRAALAADPEGNYSRLCFFFSACLCHVEGLLNTLSPRAEV
ncbi:hypothetical protein C8Q74DRAFT_275381 [Fomes fomentarius]|nr:hypothetical protein C8Q74DRAFT_275381 [Fomes fomentarius]